MKKSRFCPKNVGFLSSVLMVFLFAISFVNVKGATFTVTNTADSGVGSLRQAILDANASSSYDTINFNIPGTGVHKIAPLTALPLVLGSGGITIDGTTQPGWAVGNLVVELSGENLSNPNADGISLTNFGAATPQSFIRGLVINRFPENGIYIQDSENITIEGCYIGLAPDGVTSQPNEVGIFARTVSASTGNITIGGDTAAERNVIAGNTTEQIELFLGRAFFIKGNYIGTDETGNAWPTIKGGTGINMTVEDSVVGGPTVAERNVITAARFGMFLADSDCVVQNNYFGVGADGVTPLGFEQEALQIAEENFANAGNHLIAQNVFANSDKQAIFVRDSSPLSKGNKFTENSIFNNIKDKPGVNDSGIQTAIDLGLSDRTPNDLNDTDNGPNNLQNFPVLTSATVSGNSINIQGSLNSEARESYRIEFFANSDNKREAKRFLGFQDVATPTGVNNVAINATLAAVAYPGEYVTATATRNAAPFDTSEISDPVAVTVPSFVVTNANDSGAGSLRQAMLDANAAVGPHLITFAITPLDGTVKTINLLSPLPPITESLMIDGLTQNGADCSGQKIELNGASAGAGGDGFTVSSDNVTIQGLVINRFLGDGIVATTSDNLYRCNKIGTDANGTTDLGNGANGILLQSAANRNRIEANTISGNTGSGIRVLISNDTVIKSNIVGLSSNGLNALGNANGGILIVGGTRSIVGDVGVGEKNTVSANNGGGIFLSGTTRNRIRNNYIGTDPNGGGTTLGNTGPGLSFIGNANANIVGGQERNETNHIARNSAQGISVASGSANNLFSANLIHDNGGLGIDLNADGVTGNDAGDADTGANNLQNFPVITAAESYFGGVQATGTLNSAANTSFALEFFASPSCDGTNGEGQEYLGVVEVTTDAGGNANFVGVLAGKSIPVGHVITATATRKSAPFDTSEFSACRVTTTLSVSTLIVTNINDSGTGSLRAAINTANVSSGVSRITFNIPGPGVKTISLVTALPVISRPVIIDGLSQPGASCATVLIELNGFNIPDADLANGLSITGGAEIHGISVGGFDGFGIEFTVSGGNTVTCSRIGGDATATQSLNNDLTGIFLNRVSNNTIGGVNKTNFIYANSFVQGSGHAGIFGLASNNNVIQGNVVGIDANGNRPGIRQSFGIAINGDGNLIGGADPLARNYVSGNVTGIFLNSGIGNIVQGNHVGLGRTGLGNFNASNEFQGILVLGNDDSAVLNNVVANTIFASLGFTNQGCGIAVGGSTGLAIKGNLIGTNAAGNAVIDNYRGVCILEATEVTIGGRTPGERNIISGNVLEGIAIDQRSGRSRPPEVVIEGNYIGLAADGQTALPNSFGIRTIQNQNFDNQPIVRIGSTVLSAGNFISGNTTAGISLATANTLIQGNSIGLAANFIDSRPNGTGILLNNGANNNTIGGPGTGNTFASNGSGIATALDVTLANNNLIQSNQFSAQTSDGIRLGSSNNTIRENSFLFNGGNGITILTGGTGNRISANSSTGNTLLGIDLGNDGVTPNDTNDADLANNLQNYPVLSSANTTTVTGTLNSTPNTGFTLEFFRSSIADPSNFGEGQTYLGSMVVTTNGSGNATFNFTPSIALPAGQFVSATATNNSGDTSEFSGVRQIAGPTAAQVNIEGRVIDKDGRGISRAVVTMTEPNGNVRTTLTNPFGFYRFLSVPGGQTYVFSVGHKSYDFEQSVFTVNVEDEINDLFIVGRRRSEN